MCLRKPLRVGLYDNKLISSLGQDNMTHSCFPARWFDPGDVLVPRALLKLEQKVFY